MSITMNQALLTIFGCVISGHLLAQNAPAGGKGNLIPSEFGFDIKKSSLKAERPWERSALFRLDRNQGLKIIKDETTDKLRNPSLQKLGGLDGGGGNILVCEGKDGKMSAILLDLYEAKKNPELTIDMGPGAFEDKLEYVFKRLSKVTPIHTAHYAAMALDLIVRDTQWSENSEMPVVTDIKIATVPRGCLLVQAAIQRPVEQQYMPYSKPYFINKDLFSLLDEDSKAALVLHEVLYRQARYSGINNSDFTRSLVGLILSNTRVPEVYSELAFGIMLAKNGVGCSIPSPMFRFLETDLTGELSCQYTQFNSVSNLVISNDAFSLTLDGKLSYRHEGVFSDHQLMLSISRSNLSVFTKGGGGDFGQVFYDDSSFSVKGKGLIITGILSNLNMARAATDMVFYPLGADGSRLLLAEENREPGTRPVNKPYPWSQVAGFNIKIGSPVTLNLNLKKGATHKDLDSVLNRVVGVRLMRGKVVSISYQLDIENPSHTPEKIEKAEVDLLFEQ